MASNEQMNKAPNAEGIKSLLSELKEEMITLESYLKKYNCADLFKVYARLESNVHDLVAKTSSLQNEKTDFINNIKSKLQELIEAMKAANQIKEENEEEIKTALHKIKESVKSVGNSVLDFNFKMKKQIRALNEEMERVSNDQETGRGSEEITEMIDQLMVLIKKN